MMHCVLTAFGRLLNDNYVSFMHALIAAQNNSHPDYKVSTRVQKSPLFIKKAQPTGFYWVLTFLGFFGTLDYLNTSCNYPSSGRSFVSVRQMSPPLSSRRSLSSVRQVSLSRSILGVS